MDAVPQAPEPAKEGSFFSLARNTAILVPVLSFLGYYAPYVVGLAYHQRLLSLFDVPAGLFPSDSRQVFVSAYQATLEVWIDWTKFIVHSYAIPIGSFFIGLVFLSWIALKARKRKTPPVEGSVARKTVPKWVVLPIAFLVFGIAVASLSVSLPIALYPLLALPATLGQQGAQLVFDRKQKLLEGGCGVENTEHVYCQAVVDKDKVIAVGFTIATSESRIALYQARHTKIVKLGDATIEVMPPEDYKRYEASKLKP